MTDKLTTLSVDEIYNQIEGIVSKKKEKIVKESNNY